MKKTKTIDKIKEAISNIEKGNSIYKKINIVNICKEAGISRPTLYKHNEILDYIENQKKDFNSDRNYEYELKEKDIKIKELMNYIQKIEEERDNALIEQSNALELMKAEQEKNIIKLN
jgi:ribosomal protein S15P/S13E